MKLPFPIFPESASSVSGEVDALFAVWSVISIFFSLLIAVLIVYFAVRYRRRHEDQVGEREKAALWLEITWSAVPLAIMLVMFAWGTRVYVKIYRAPHGALEFTSIGRQWMWKFQHPQGQREINNLHVPRGQAIKLNLASEDVIHSFYIPAFRVKQDAVPGKSTSLWFKATKTGTFHIFCAEYCGAEHSKMIGSITVMEPADYQAWLTNGPPAGKTPIASGAELFQTLACETCHKGANGRIQRGPELVGLFGNTVQLADGTSLVADETYLRESILNPQAKLVKGWDSVMPTFQGQISEEQLSQLLAYVKSLGGPKPAASPAASHAAAGLAAPAATVSANSPNVGSAAKN
jgi:cytochrome c oxidase subunit 2